MCKNKVINDQNNPSCNFMSCFAVSSCLCVKLQPVDVLPHVVVQVTGLHGPVRAVGSGRARHQRSSSSGEEIKRTQIDAVALDFFRE